MTFRAPFPSRTLNPPLAEPLTPASRSASPAKAAKEAALYTNSDGSVVEMQGSVRGLDRLVPSHIRAACETEQGLIVISAPVAEDVADMVWAVVTWNAQRRPCFVVAFGETGGLQRVAEDAIVSERPLPTKHGEMRSALDAAVRERPDVLVVTASDTVPAVDALVSAAVGRLVIVGVVARTAPGALEVLLKDIGPNRKALAAAFRSACSWRGFHRPDGRWAVISDVLVTSERVSALIEAADITGLHMAQYNGEEGMWALDGALATAVVRRQISLREAAACAINRKILLSVVRQEARKIRMAEPEQRGTLVVPNLSAAGAAPGSVPMGSDQTAKTRTPSRVGYTTGELPDVLDSPDPLWPTLVRFLTMSETQTTGDNDLPQSPEYPTDEPARESKPTLREGLPKSYRMRADAHYVEQLDTPRESLAIAEKPSPLRAQAISPEISPVKTLDIHDALVRALADIESSTHLLSSSPASLLESAGTDVIRAETWRASCLLHANRVLQSGVTPGQTLCSARRLVTVVAERAESERRLRGFSLHTEHEIPENLMIAGDPRVLITALSGLLLATCAVIEPRSNARVALSASVDATRQIEFAISEVGTGVSMAWESKAFDSAWQERPGGTAAAVWMLAARTIAESYGGRVGVAATARGATVKMVMPVSAA